MARIKPVLGRGLASLIPRQAAVPPLPLGGQDDGVSNDIIASIALDRILRNPYQPRAEFEPVALDELKRSIQEKGIIQPVTVRRLGDEYQLISGERRVRAAREAGLKQIPAYIIRVPAGPSTSRTLCSTVSGPPTTQPTCRTEAWNSSAMPGSTPRARRRRVDFWAALAFILCRGFGPGELFRRLI